jgi:hypothetical protein
MSAGSRWTLADQPAFWAASAVVFATNAVICAVLGLWWLALLEAGTATLALVAAAAVAGWRVRRDPPPATAGRRADP